MARFNGGAVGCYDPKSGQLVAEVRVPKEAGRQVEGIGMMAGSENGIVDVSDLGRAYFQRWVVFCRTSS